MKKTTFSIIHTIIFMILSIFFLGCFAYLSLTSLEGITITFGIFGIIFFVLFVIALIKSIFVFRKENK